MIMKRKKDLTEEIEANKPLEKKKILPRLIAFLIFFALAVTFITLGITNMGRREEGLQTISAPLDESVPYYELGVSFQHYFSGSSGDIKLAVRELEELYASSLKDACRLLDPVNSYDGWVNLAYLNRHRGEEITVSRELYDTLAEALALTEERGGYSLFAGALYAEWEALRFALEPGDFDPLNDPGERQRLEKLTEATGGLSNFSLELLDDEACRLRFTVDRSYEALLEELEIADAPILDLNLLRDACKLQLVAARLEARGYDRGYLSADSGVTLALSAYKDGGEFCFYGLWKGEAAPAAELAIRPGACAVQMRAFGNPEEPGWDTVEQGSETFLRHPWLPADGAYRELLLSAFVSGEGVSPARLCYDCLRLYGCRTAEEAETLAKSLPGPAALLLRQDPDIVLVTDAAIRADTEHNYTAELLK